MQALTQLSTHRLHMHARYANVCKSASGQRKPRFIFPQRQTGFNNKCRASSAIDFTGSQGIENKMAKRGTKEWRENVSMSRVGIATHDFTKSSREKLRLRKLGELNPNWRGGITPGNKSARESAQYKEWRKGVFKRDNYTCVLCGDNKGGNLEADHIKPFALFKEFRYEISNGRTLCKPCHRKTETWGSLTPAHLN